jgi:hypothetical protein
LICFHCGSWFGGPIVGTVTPSPGGRRGRGRWRRVRRSPILCTGGLTSSTSRTGRTCGTR